MTAHKQNGIKIRLNESQPNCSSWNIKGSVVSKRFDQNADPAMNCGVQTSDKKYRQHRLTDLKLENHNSIEYNSISNA